jgi:hypothetical protein
MDPQRLRENFALVGGHGEDVAAYFYSAPAYFSGPEWNADLERDRVTAYGVVSQVMVEAAGDAP